MKYRIKHFDAAGKFLCYGVVYDTEQAARDARPSACRNKCEIVKVLTHEESKNKFAAKVLRELAEQNPMCARAMRKRANELWPEPKAGK